MGSESMAMPVIFDTLSACHAGIFPFIIHWEMADGVTPILLEKATAPPLSSTTASSFLLRDIPNQLALLTDERKQNQQGLMSMGKRPAATQPHRDPRVTKQVKDLLAEAKPLEEIATRAKLSLEKLRLLYSTEIDAAGVNYPVYATTTKQRQPTEDRAAIGARIREARNARRISQHDLGVELGITAGAVGQWELGLSSPSISIADELREALGVSIEWLLYGRSDEPSDRLRPATKPECEVLKAMKEMDNPQQDMLAGMVGNFASPKSGKGRGR